ncbi:hypothetical protein PVMG_03424 [Plasmodium vivax Mauritania I]|uniref:Uncharacterized protein n=2 Tax=Plasmodium vivax TaxID=5855 RepID=A0A0J9VR74_PLAVI|nr:hypothetical protein PVMG_03424 [Plasmodium vivax Mauritania I]
MIRFVRACRSKKGSLFATSVRLLKRVKVSPLKDGVIKKKIGEAQGKVTVDDALQYFTKAELFFLFFFPFTCVSAYVVAMWTLFKANPSSWRRRSSSSPQAVRRFTAHRSPLTPPPPQVFIFAERGLDPLCAPVELHDVERLYKPEERGDLHPLQVQAVDLVAAHGIEERQGGINKILILRRRVNFHNH